MIVVYAALIVGGLVFFGALNWIAVVGIAIVLFGYWITEDAE